MKVCYECKIEKSLSEFSWRKDVNGHRNICKKCRSIQTKQWRQNNKEKIKEQGGQYYLDNKEKYKEQHRQYYIDNKEQIDKQNKQWRDNNKGYIKIQQKQYCEDNREEIQKYQKQYDQDNREKINKRKTKRRCSDIQYKIADNLRTRLYGALKNNRKVGSAVRDLGCSIEKLKQYLESKFQSGMSWKNWNFYGWHIDHIIPLSKFDLTNRKQFLEACNFKNLQPMWAEDNLKKSNKVIDLQYE